MRTLSIIGKDSHTDEHVVGYHNTGDRMKYWGSSAHFGEASGDSSLDQPSSPFPASVRCWWRARWLRGSWQPSQEPRWWAE